MCLLIFSTYYTISFLNLVHNFGIEITYTFGCFIFPGIELLENQLLFLVHILCNQIED